MSADGSTAIVGGPGDNNDTGAAWVFIQNNGAWTQQQKLVGSNSMSMDETVQGTSVALSADGNTAIVGGRGDNGGIGAAWVFTRTNGAWTEQQKLVGSGVTGSYADQGTSVALSADGNIAIVGGPQDNSDNAWHRIGAAWVFTRSSGTWTEQQKLVGSGVTGSYANQGTSVALSADGSTAVVGGPYDNGVESGEEVITSYGAVWVFTLSNGTWTQQQKLVRQWRLASFGTSVALSADGNTIIAGAPQPQGTVSAPSGGGVGLYPEQRRLDRAAATARHRCRLRTLQQG